MYIALVLSSSSRPNNPMGCGLMAEETGPEESRDLPSITQQ